MAGQPSQPGPQERPTLTVLSGGTGGGRFLQGLCRAVDPSRVCAVVNVGDNFRLFGLLIAPDLDIVAYHLAGLVEESQGWGIANDTFACLETLARLGHEPWFRLGDRDLAVHLHRTLRLAEGWPLSRVTAEVARALGVRARILPVTDDPVETWVLTERGPMHLEEFWVRHRARLPVRGVEYRGAEQARPAPGVLPALYEAKAVVLAPSHPLFSIGVLLAVPGVRDALQSTPAPVLAVSSVEDLAPGSPDHRVLTQLGLEPSARGLARLYRDFADGVLMDPCEAHLAEDVRALGLKAFVAPARLRTPEDRLALGRSVLQALADLGAPLAEGEA